MTFKEICKDLEEIIVSAYQGSLTLEEAERYSGRFLHAQMQVSEHLKASDLEARMRKSGLKAVKAAVYTDACSKVERKPTEGALDHLINQTPIVSQEQEALDIAEVEKADLERYYQIFREGHIFFRGMAKGTYGG